MTWKDLAILIGVPSAFAAYTWLLMWGFIRALDDFMRSEHDEEQQ